MAIELQTYASGDTDYIAKLNSNASIIQAAINALQAASAAAGGPSPVVSAGLFMSALFNGEDCLIGTNSYVPELGATSLEVATGSMYMSANQSVVMSLIPYTISFLAQVAGTYYIVIDATGVPALGAFGGGAAWKVVWSGSAFIGEPERVCNCFYDANEATASREHTAVDYESPPASPPETIIQYRTLDDRLEAIEAVAGSGVRRLGVTLDGAGVVLSAGVKGQLQLDYAGTIIGWCVIADAVGSIAVDVQRATSESPPAAPSIPNTTTDKISASAPIAISSAQSASGGVEEVETWDTLLAKWDVIQFSVVSASVIKRATLYIRIQET